jgi:uncharacterized membrane protein YGL010W
MKPRLVALMQDYESAHQHPTNRLTHEIAIPLIVFHIVAMLDWVPLGTAGGWRLSLAHPVYLAAVAWYVALDLRLGVLMAVLYGLCLPLGRMAPWQLVVAAAVVGWLTQLAGHSLWEKNRPAFLRNMLHALVGPLYFVARAVRLWPARITS